MRVAVDDAHDALAMAHQLPDAPVIERGLDVVHGVDPGQEHGHRARSLAVERLGRLDEQPVEVVSTSTRSSKSRAR
jgi:hypothetical protein